MRYFMLFCLCVLSACATRPPVQAMAEARLAIETAKNLTVPSPSDGQTHLAKAERALDQATKAVDAQQFELAQREARKAKRYAQMAARERSKASIK